MTNKFAIQGNAYYSKNIDEVTCLKNVLICIDCEGIIEHVIKAADPNYLKTLKEYETKNQLKVLATDEILLPGFIDLHIHAPQWPQAGLALDKPLEVWLNEYTFPLEAKFSDLDFASRVYEDVVKTTLRNGTTTAMYFATIHRDASLVLAKACGELGQRAFVGRVAMDEEDGAPAYYRDESSEASIIESQSFIDAMKEVTTKYPQKVFPVVTPRFIPTCSEESLEGHSRLASRYDIHIQSHVSESDWEHNYVIDKTRMNDTFALNKYGLLTSKTILAHGNYVNDEDGELLAQQKTTIAHCPLSNVYFANAVLPVKRLVDQGVNIGLATDISGGYSYSMYNAIRQAVISSRMLKDGVDPCLEANHRGTTNESLSLNNAFYLATVAGGIALGLTLGKFVVGQSFDAQLVCTSEGIPNFGKRSDEDILHQVLLLAQSQNIKEVWVQGQVI